MADDIQGGTWRDRAPRSLTDLFDLYEQPIFTSADRRWLWCVESGLAVSATNDEQRQLARDLRAYLTETCEHHRVDYARSEWRHPVTGVVEDVIPAHRQCLWCHDVEWVTP